MKLRKNGYFNYGSRNMPGFKLFMRDKIEYINSSFYNVDNTRWLDEFRPMSARMQSREGQNDQ